MAKESNLGLLCSVKQLDLSFDPLFPCARLLDTCCFGRQSLATSLRSMVGGGEAVLLIRA